MPPIVPSAPNQRMQLYQVLESDSVLHGPDMLPQGPGSVLPRLGATPEAAIRPFLFVRLEGSGSRGNDDLDLATWVIEAHDLPDAGLWTIDRIMERIKWLFNGAFWQPTTATGSSQAFRSWWLGRTGELPDAGFDTTKALGRVQVVVS